MNPIVIAIPVFFVMIGLEYLLSLRQGRDVYRFGDAITNLSCGVGDQSTAVFSGLVRFGAYSFVWHYLRIVELEGMAEWIAAFFLYDMSYYWWHRFSHEVNIGWATHVVHHQSQDYNLAVALRQSGTGFLTNIPFYMPMALLGIDPFVFGVTASISLLYQFWIHTELIDKLGPFEWVMNTPSHHRVHHAINPSYLDKNYAAILIIWDRMFGSFIVETEAPVYGTVKPLDSYDPVWAQLWYFVLLYRDWRDASDPMDRWRVLYMAPGFRPANLEPYPEPVEIVPLDQRKYDPDVSSGLAGYVMLQFPPAAAGILWMLMEEKTASYPVLFVAMSLILWATWAWSGLFERRPHALWHELARIVGTTAAMAGWLASADALIAVVMWAVLSVTWLLTQAAWLSNAPSEAA